MEFTNNYSDLLLLSNRNITFKSVDGESEFELVPMKTWDVFFNEDLMTFISFLDMDLETLKANFAIADIESHYDFLSIMLTLGTKHKEARVFANKLLLGLQKIVPDVNFEGNEIFIKDMFLSSSVFESIVEIIFKILSREKIIIKEDDDEFTRMEKEAKLRAERIKKTSKPEEEGKLEDSLIALIYEYPQYTLEDLFQLNIFTFNYLFKFIGKIANYEVSKIAAGNGLAKKHKYFTEK